MFCDLLVEYGADVNQPGYEGAYPLHSCAGAEQPSAEVCQLLINNGAVVNVYEATAYQVRPFAPPGHASCVLFATHFQARQPPFPPAPPTQQTPAMWAARSGYAAVLSLLITYGADILVR